MSTNTDLLGRTYTEPEARIVALYEELKQLEQSDELPPCASANVRVALAALGVAVTDLALVYEHLTDHGC